MVAVIGCTGRAEAHRYPPSMAEPRPAPTADERWEGDRTSRWLGQVEGLERQLAPVSDVLLAAAAPVPGERVLDVGCGAGSTTRRVARAVAPGGSATGIDVSAEMVEAARAATEPSDGDVRWTVADVVGWEPEPGAVDLVLSRFGVMFFSDPAAAFATLAAATRPGGRLAVAVWARRDASELFEVPLQAALGALSEAGVTPPAPPLDDGPFSLHDPDAVTALLQGAGWVDVACATHDLSLPFGGGLDPRAAARSALEIGPTQRVLAGVDDAVRDRAREAVAEALAAWVDTGGRVVLGGRVVVVTAHRPG